MNELGWQRKIIKSVRDQGGYGKKWSTQMTVGVPDLVLALPDVGLFLMEVKLFTGAKDRFSRKVDTTPKQRLELGRFIKGGGLAVVGVVVNWEKRGNYLVALPPDVEHLSADECVEKYPTRPWVAGTGFDVRHLMREHIKRGTQWRTA